MKLLILDEPTASLNEKDSEALLNLLLRFKAQGISSILISHKLNEISKVADSITVLRDGGTVETLDCGAEEVSEDRIIRGMVGRTMEDRYPKREPKIGETIFQVEDWSAFHPIHNHVQVVKNVDLNIRRGEIVGIAGLMGAGRTEFAMSLFGRSYGRRISGRVALHGKPIDVSTVEKAVANGIAYATEDRKTYGLVLAEDIRKNVTLANLEEVSRNFVIDEIAGARSRQRLSWPDAHPLLQRVSGDSEPLRRQPAEGRLEQMVVLRSGDSHSGRAHPRHRCGCEIRDLYDHQQARRCREGCPHDLLGDARIAGHV